MVKEQVINPFYIGKYLGEHYFCDRVNDYFFAAYLATK